MNKEKGIKSIYLMQDLGFLGFLLCIFGILVLVGSVPDSKKIECLIMFLILCLPIMFTMSKMPLLAYTFVGLQVLCYTIYKLYLWSIWNEPITYIAYAWIIIPVLAIVSLQVFVHGITKLEISNEILVEQVQELVMVDPLTGLYNRRSLYNDLTRQIALANRGGITIGLMVVKLKYSDELKRILSSQQFDRLKQSMAEITEDTLRIEDKLYSIDDDGGLVVFMHCDKTGAVVVENRLKAELTKKDAFKDDMQNTIKIEVKTGYVMYDKNKIANAIDFFQQAENELQYDV